MANIFRRPRVGLARLALYLLVFVGSALALNGWIFTGPGIEWSRTLVNPAWAAPGWVIGAVWTGQFALLAVSATLIDRNASQDRKDLARFAVIVWWLICVGWTWGYFALQSIANGVYITLAALVMGPIVITLVWSAARAAAFALIPLQCWLVYATALILTVRELNL